MRLLPSNLPRKRMNFLKTGSENSPKNQFFKGFSDLTGSENSPKNQFCKGFSDLTGSKIKFVRGFRKTGSENSPKNPFCKGFSI